MEDRRQEHDCFKEGDIAVLLKFMETMEKDKDRQQRFYDNMIFWFITNFGGLIIIAILVVFTLIKLSSIKIH